jgi:hypothetical protein
MWVLIIGLGSNGLVLSPRHRYLHHAVCAPCHGAGYQVFKRHIGVAKGAPQHWHVNACHNARGGPVGSRQGSVARRRAKYIDHDENRSPAESVDRSGDGCLCGFHRGARQDVDCVHRPATLGIDMFSR